MCARSLGTVNSECKIKSLRRLKVQAAEHCIIGELGTDLTGEERRRQDMVTQTTGSLLACRHVCLPVTQWSVPQTLHPLSLICRVRLISPLSLSSHVLCWSESALIAVTLWLVSRQMGHLRCCQAETMAQGQGAQKVQICGWNIWKCEECGQKRAKKSVCSRWSKKGKNQESASTGAAAWTTAAAKVKRISKSRKTTNHLKGTTRKG